MIQKRFRYITTIIGTLPIVLLIGFIRTVGAISSIPIRIGKKIRIENVSKRFVYHTVDLKRVYEFREDLLYIFEENFHRADMDTENYDRWGLLRQIDIGRENAKRNLQDGEFVLSLGGGLASILSGMYLDVQFAGLLLTFVVILFSILVTLRIVVTDLLSYHSIGMKNENIEMLALKAGWNRNQINHGSSLVLAAVLLSFASSNRGYNIGIVLVNWFGKRANPIDNQRYDYPQK